MNNIKPYIVKEDPITKEKYAIDNVEYVKQQQQKQYEFFLKKSNIPVFYWNISFDDYKGVRDLSDVVKIKQYALQCCDPKFKYINLYLWGEHGTQKTALLCNVGKEAIKQGLKVSFILAGDLIDKLLKLQGYSYNEQIYFEIDCLKKSDMILIDDFADIEKSLYWQKAKNIIISEWDRFLRNAISNGVKLVVSSNFSLDGIQDHFGSSLYELIYRNFTTIQLTESIKDFRKKQIEGVLK